MGLDLRTDLAVELKLRCRNCFQEIRERGQQNKADLVSNPEYCRLEKQREIDTFRLDWPITSERWPELLIPKNWHGQNTLGHECCDHTQ